MEDAKLEKVSEEHLEKIQSSVSSINKAQMELGDFEVKKHQLLHFIAGAQDKLGLLRAELDKEYGTDNINIQDGTINYEADGETDKED